MNIVRKIIKNGVYWSFLRVIRRLKKPHNRSIKLFMDSIYSIKNKIIQLSASQVNENKNFASNYYLAAKAGLDCLVGNELAMQKKLNISIQMPKDKESNLPMHSDIYAGESPFEVVVWIPLMDIKAYCLLFYTVLN